MMDTMERNIPFGGEATPPTDYGYDHPEGPVTPAAYLLSYGEKDKYLLLRWRVDPAHGAESFRYTLEQMDSGGRILAVSEHTCPRVPALAAGEDYIPTAGIVAHSRCADVKVTVTEVRSRGYVYRLRGNTYEVDYEGDTPWIYEKKIGEVTPKKSLRVKSKGAIHGRFLWVGPLLAVLALWNLLFFTVFGPDILIGVIRWIRDLADIIIRFGW